MFTPAMEAFGKSCGFLILEGKEKLTRTFWLFDSHVLNINLYIEFLLLLSFQQSFLKTNFTCADLYANFISTSLHFVPSHKKTWSPLSKIMISSSAKSS